MAITPTDETNLLLPLFDGIFEVPVWETFLRRLMQRTGAQRVRMAVRSSTAPSQPPLRRRVVADRFAARSDPGEPEVFDAALYASLRPNRVYTLDEIREFDDPVARKRQDATLASAAIGDARLIRVAGKSDLHAWIVLLHERPAFSAADSALLTALAPAIATVLATFAAIGELRLRAAVAEESLSMMGIGQAVLDRDGRVLVADNLAQAELVLPFASAPQPGIGQAEVAQACVALEDASPAARRVVQLDGERPRLLLLRPAMQSAEGMPHPAAAVASFRNPRREDSINGASVAAQTFGLSNREAALAEAISRGASIIDAGKALKLTRETARNYSKRIYAKTGTNGQADLVRLMLSGLVVLA